MTESQKQFDEDYKVIRRLYVTCKFKDKEKILNWIRQTGEVTLAHTEVELIKRLRRFGSQSGYERAELRLSHEDNHE